MDLPNFEQVKYQTLIQNIIKSSKLRLFALILFHDEPECDLRINKSLSF